MLPALTLALITNKRMGATSMVARAFSLPVFQWLAGITYDIFLTHPLVRDTQKTLNQLSPLKKLRSLT